MVSTGKKFAQQLKYLHILAYNILGKQECVFYDSLIWKQFIKYFKYTINFGTEAILYLHEICSSATIFNLNYEFALTGHVHSEYLKDMSYTYKCVPGLSLAR